MPSVVCAHVACSDAVRPSEKSDGYDVMTL